MGLTSKEHVFFVQDVQEIDACGSKFYQLTGSDFSKPTDFVRLPYEKHNLDNCENCRKNHQNVLAEITERFKKFPACCSQHLKLLKENWFTRTDFSDVPRLHADKLFYAWHHILHFIDHENWKEEIFNFIEYIFQSFGSFPVGYGEPLYFKTFTDQLQALVQRLDDNKKKSEILTFIHAQMHPDENNRTDVNILLSVYNEWYKTFPFELSFFTHLVPHFSRNIPLIRESHTNKYLGLATARLQSKEELIAILIQATEKIISEINSKALYENGQITDFDKLQLELILQERKQQLKAGYQNKVTDADKAYRKMLKAWLKDEISFIKKLRPVAERILSREERLHDAILSACCKMQENKIFWDADENTRTRQILDLLPANFFTKDQSYYGASETGKKQGSVDGVIVDEKKDEYFLEAFNLSSLDKTVITRHIHKLESNYDSKGVQTKYIVVYCNVEDGAFQKLSKSYVSFLEKEIVFRFALVNVKEQSTKYTNTLVVSTTHLREGKNVTLHHVMIKMPARTGPESR